MHCTKLRAERHPRPLTLEPCYQQTIHNAVLFRDASKIQSKNPRRLKANDSRIFHFFLALKFSNLFSCYVLLVNFVKPTVQKGTSDSGGQVSHHRD